MRIPAVYRNQQITSNLIDTKTSSNSAVIRKVARKIHYFLFLITIPSTRGKNFSINLIVTEIRTDQLLLIKDIINENSLFPSWNYERRRMLQNSSIRSDCH